MSSAFSTSAALVDELLLKGKEVSKGKSLAEAEIEPKWMSAYGVIARRCRDDKDFSLSRYPYEQGPSVSAFSGGFFEHREWPVRRAMEKHNSMRPVFEFEANYTNAAGYWMAFNKSAMALRHEAMEDKDDAKAQLYDVWAQIATHYGLRVTGLRVEFYRMVARDPTYAKLVMPSLEQRNELPASDDLIEPMDKLETHMSTQLMKAVATLNASNATKRSGKGGPAAKQ